MALSKRDQAMEDYRVTVRHVPDDPRGAAFTYNVHDTRLENEKSVGQLAVHGAFNANGDTKAGWSAVNDTIGIYPDI